MVTINTGSIPTNIVMSNPIVSVHNQLDFDLVPSDTSKVSVDAGEIPENIFIITPPKNCDNTNLYSAGEVISGHTPVYVGLNGLLYTSSVEDINSCKQCIGIANNSSDIQGLVEVIEIGSITHLGWTFTPNSNIYIGVKVLVEVEPIESFIAIIGYSSTSTTVVVKPQAIIIKG